MPDSNPCRSTAIIESILLLEADYRSLDDLVRISGLTLSEVQQAIKELSDHYHNSLHGVAIDSTEEGYLMIPKIETWNAIARSYKKKHAPSLSKAALETLTIIAYTQPVTRASIEGIRGANSESSIKSLLKQQVITVRGTLKAPGNPPLYSTTPLFLRLFNLPSLKELPHLSAKEIQQFQQRE